MVKRLLRGTAFCAALVVVAQPAAALKREVEIKNDCPDAPLLVSELTWTKDGSVIGTSPVSPSWSIPASSTAKRQFDVPTGTNDHSISQAVISAGAGHGVVVVASTAIGLDVEDLNLYHDSAEVTLYTGYDIDGPGSPQFCRSPMTLVSGQWVCSDATPPDPVLFGSYSIRPPTVPTTGLGALAALAVGLALAGLTRRLRQP